MDVREPYDVGEIKMVLGVALLGLILFLTHSLWRRWEHRDDTTRPARAE